MTRKVLHEHTARSGIIWSMGVVSLVALLGLIARLYMDLWNDREGHVPPELTNLPSLIRLGKLWSVVEFLANARLSPGDYPEETISFIVRELPGWMKWGDEE